MVVRKENRFVFALTYGTEGDWYRNITAANGGELLWDGREYCLSNPRRLDPIEGSATFGRVKGVILRRFGIRDFIETDAREK